MNNIFSKINEILKNYSEGNKKRAYSNLKKISNKYPKNEKILFNLAMMEQDQGMIDLAKKNYINIIDIYDSFNAKKKLYLIYLTERDYLSALNIINSILKNNYDDYDVLLDKAYINYKTNYIESSIELSSYVLAKENSNTKAINLIGQCYLEKNDLKKAESLFLKGLSIESNNVSILNSMGRLYFEMWNLEKAENFYLKALDQKKSSYQTLNNIAGFYMETNNSKKALLYYQGALKILPNEPTILNNLSKAYLSLNKLDEAEKNCLLAIKIKDDDSFKKILSIIYFRKQNYEKAWKDFDGRLGLNEFAKKNDSYTLIKKKLLRNKNIIPSKKLLIIREQGVGDEILYGTIYEDLLNSHNDTIIESDERLIPLFINSFDNKFKNNFFKLGSFSKDPSKLSQFDQILYAGSLGYYFRNNINKFPKKNYIKIDQRNIDLGEKNLEICKKKYKIGLSWKSFKNIYSNQKSLNLNDLNDIINLEDIDFINLQYGEVRNEVNEYNNSSKNQIIDLKNIDLFNDFLKVGSILKNLDLFITVSNSTAHLAGALGVKTILIKPFNQATFHYWNQPTTKTPWYSNVELLERTELNKSNNFRDKILSILN